MTDPGDIFGEGDNNEEYLHDLKKHNRDLKAENEKLKAKNDELGKGVEHYSRETTRLVMENEKLKAQVEQLTAEIEMINELHSTEAFKKEIEYLGKRLAAMEKVVEAARNLVGPVQCYKDGEEIDFKPQLEMAVHELDGRKG